MSDSPSEQYRRKPFYKYFGAYVLIFGLLNLAAGSYSFFMKVYPAYAGTEAEATITKMETKQYRRKLVKYFFEYSFKDRQGNLIQSRNLVDKPFYLERKEGDTFPVRYLESYPAAHSFTGSSSPIFAMTLVALGLIISIAGLIGHTMHLQREREAAE